MIRDTVKRLVKRFPRGFTLLGLQEYLIESSFKKIMRMFNSVLYRDLEIFSFLLSVFNLQ